MNTAEMEKMMLEIREEQIRKTAIEEERKRAKSERNELLKLLFTALMSIVSVIALIRTF